MGMSDETQRVPTTRYRVNLNRFRSFVTECSSMVTLWHLRLFQCSYAALELDMISGRAVRERILTKAAAQAEVRASTGTTTVAIDDRTLGSCAQNALAIAMLYLSDPFNKELIVIVMRITKPVTDQHTASERVTRDVYGASDWLRKHVEGEHHKHLFEVWKSISDPDFRDGVGLLECQQGAQLDLSPERICEDDEKCGLAGEFVLTLLSLRLGRSMWVLGNCPVSLCKLASHNIQVRGEALAMLQGAGAR